MTFRIICFCYFVILLIGLGVSKAEDNALKEPCGALRLGQDVEVGLNEFGEVTIQRQGKRTTYAATYRDLTELYLTIYINIFPNVQDFINFLKGKRVLDVGVGQGQFVEDLQQAQIDATGIDIFLLPELRHLPYFRQADAVDLPYENNSIDVITSHFSIFYYEFTNRQLLSLILTEFTRVLRPGGKIYLFPVYYPILERLLDNHNQLKITFMPQGLNKKPGILELTKVK